jgi:hypothetical protein
MFVVKGPVVGIQETWKIMFSSERLHRCFPPLTRAAIRGVLACRACLTESLVHSCTCTLTTLTTHSLSLDFPRSAPALTSTDNTFFALRPDTRASTLRTLSWACGQAVVVSVCELKVRRQCEVLRGCVQDLRAASCARELC